MDGQMKEPITLEVALAEAAKMNKEWKLSHQGPRLKESISTSLELMQTRSQSVIFDDNTRYTGKTKHGKPEDQTGMAELIYASGKRYTGQFSNGFPEGKGALHHEDGSMYKGSFSAGQPDGEGELEYPGGDAYRGEFKAGHREGLGTYWFPDGAVMVSKYKAGSPEGPGVWWNSDRKKAARLDAGKLVQRQDLEAARLLAIEKLGISPAYIDDLVNSQWNGFQTGDLNYADEQTLVEADRTMYPIQDAASTTSTWRPRPNGDPGSTCSTWRPRLTSGDVRQLSSPQSAQWNTDAFGEDEDRPMKAASPPESTSRGFDIPPVVLEGAEVYEMPALMLDSMLSKPQLETLRKFFNTVDVDETRTIKAKEFVNAMKALNMQEPSENEAYAVLSSFNVHSASKLQFDEFVNLVQEGIKMSDGAGGAYMPTEAMQQKSAEKLNQRHISRLREWFNKLAELDGDGCNTVDAKAVQRGGESLGMVISDADASAVFKTFDIIAQSKLPFEEYVNVIQEVLDMKYARLKGRMTRRQLSRVQQQFSKLDTDGNGTIEAREFQVGMETLGMPMTETDAASVFKLFDVNGDSTLQFEEYAELIQEAFIMKVFVNKGKLSQRQLSRLKVIFSKIDAEGNGIIEARDLVRGVDALGTVMTTADAAAVFKSFDITPGSRLPFDEYVSLVEEALEMQIARANAKLTQRQMVRVKVMFVRLDEDGNGTIEAKEFKKALYSLGMEIGDAEMNAVFTAFDVNGDSKLQFDEYKDLVAEAFDMKSGEAHLTARQREIVVNLFDAMCTDSTGTIDSNLVVSGMAALGIDVSASEAAALLKSYSQKPDGKVQVDRLLTVMQEGVRMRTEAEDLAKGNSLGNVFSPQGRQENSMDESMMTRMSMEEPPSPELHV
jgi:Ca2+-binding EF-hand superfamily protein